MARRARRPRTSDRLRREQEPSSQELPATKDLRKARAAAPSEPDGAVTCSDQSCAGTQSPLGRCTLGSSRAGWAGWAGWAGGVQVAEALVLLWRDAEADVGKGGQVGGGLRDHVADRGGGELVAELPHRLCLRRLFVLLRPGIRVAALVHGLLSGPPQVFGTISTLDGGDCYSTFVIGPR